MNKTSPFAHLRSDVPAAVVVFLVALPLCLGIALASGAPPLAGVIAGVIGGVVVGALSGSSVGVSGPAAGLAVIVLVAIQELGDFNLFLCALVLAGVIQAAMGVLRAGVIAYYFPSSVIKGMLAGIGIIIILKEIPYALGLSADFEWSSLKGGLSALTNAVNLGTIIIAVVGLAFLLAWDQPRIRDSVFGKIPGPLLAVVSGIVLGRVFQWVEPLKMGSDFFIDLPTITLANASSIIELPDFSGLTSGVVWKTAAVIAVVASLETLLCVEATDKMDPRKNVTPKNRELLAQGVGNALSGLVGGLPITQVIVRSSANIQSGGRTKVSIILHGAFLLLSLLLIPGFLATIPMASLAAVLFVVGYKLAKPVLFKQMWAGGKHQFIPFIATVLGVVFTDLLTGVMIGMGFGIFAILYNNYVIPFHLDREGHEEGQPVRLELSEDVSFLNKASIQRTLNELPRGAHVIIDASRCIGLDPDVEEIIRDAEKRAPSQGVIVELIGLDKNGLVQRGNGAEKRGTGLEQEVLEAVQKQSIIPALPKSGSESTSSTERAEH